MTTNDVSTISSASRAPGAERIELRLPGTPHQLPLARTLAAELAARMDFNLDEVDDLRMAVDEACATLVELIRPNATLSCVFDVSPEVLQVRASAPTRDATVPASDTFGWRVLTALVDMVDTELDPSGEVSILLRKQRSRTSA